MIKVITDFLNSHKLQTYFNKYLLEIPR